MFLVNLLLALAWMVVSGRFEPVDFLYGFVIGFLAIILMQRTQGRSDYWRQNWAIGELLVFALWMIIRSHIALAQLTLRPGRGHRPAIVGVPLDVRSDVAITLLAHLVSLTPGTISLDVSPDRRMLYVHTIAMHDAEGFRRAIKTKLERRVQQVLDPEGEGDRHA